MNLRKLQLFLLIVVLAIFPVACNKEQVPKEEPENEPPPSDEEVIGKVEEEVIKSNDRFIILQNAPESDARFNGQAVKLQAVTIEEDTVKKTGNAAWKSTNEEIATVDDHGLVTVSGVEGTAKIIAERNTELDYINVKVSDSGTPTLVKEEDENYSLSERILAALTLEEKVGQMIIADFRQEGGKAVTAITPAIEKQMKDYHIGGVILFAENIVDTGQTVKLTDQFQATSSKLGLFLSTDQEGGIVTRINGGTAMPGNMALGAAGSAELAEKVGTAIGEELLALGFNMNFAPSLDVNDNPDNPVIGVRSFGETPELVAEMGNGLIDGLQLTGVIATAKHFPGHGDTVVDSHIGIPVVEESSERLHEIELMPFKDAIDHGIDSIMMSHVAYPALDPSVIVSEKSGQSIQVPASLSREIITSITREEMGYQGVIVTDAMEMGAIDQHFEPAEAAVKAIQAGTDIVLMPKNLDEAVPGIIEAVKTGEISQQQVDESVKRIISLKLKRGILKEEEAAPLEERISVAGETVGSENHKEIEKQAAEQSITLVKNKKVLPLSNLDEEDKIVVIGRNHIKELGDALKEHHANVEVIELGVSYTLSTSAHAAIQEADYIIAGTYSADVGMRSHNHPQIKMMKQIMGFAKCPVIAVAIQNPYDLMSYSEVNAYLAQYGYQPASFRAVASVIFGETDPVGKLPVSIPDGNGGILYSVGHGLNY